MKFFCVILFLCAFEELNAQLLSFDFETLTGSEESDSSVYEAPGVLPAIIKRGAGVSPSGNAGRFNSSAWSTAASPDTSDYLEITVKTVPGFRLLTTGIRMQHQRSGTGPVKLVVRSSLDGFVADCILETVIDDITSTQEHMLHFIEPFLIEDSLSFRVYAYQSESGGGSWGPGDGSGADIEIDGIVLPQGNTILTGPVAPHEFCVGAGSDGTGIVSFSSFGSFQGIFTAYLSDENGDFSSEIAVGSLAVSGNDMQGSIPITLPGSLADGNGYRLRITDGSGTDSVIAGDPFVISNGPGTPIQLQHTFINNAVELTWTNPTSCYDEVMVVIKNSGNINQLPTGDGSLYIADPAMGAGTPFDGGNIVFKGNGDTETITGLNYGSQYFMKIFSRKGTAWKAGPEIFGTPYEAPEPGEILINQFSPDYAAAGDEYVELVNTTGKFFDLSALEIRYQTATGNNGSAGASLTGILMPRQYWLLASQPQVDAGLTSGIARDGIFEAGMAANGQLALIRISDDVKIDGVGYGAVTGGDYFETSPVVQPSSNGGIRRIKDGVDTDNNVNDFTKVAGDSIRLRNSGSFPLPVYITNMRASLIPDGQIEICWQNPGEAEVDSYELEYSTSGHHFRSVKTVYPQGNNGASIVYCVRHQPDAAPVHFYRVKLTVQGGDSWTGAVMRIRNRATGHLVSVFPNPVHNRSVSVKLPETYSGLFDFRLVNINGVEVYRTGNRLNSDDGQNLIMLPENIASGIYLMHLIFGPERHISKIIIE